MDENLELAIFCKHPELKNNEHIVNVSATFFDLFNILKTPEE
jgi:hypothetical protein